MLLSLTWAQGTILIKYMIQNTLKEHTLFPVCSLARHPQLCLGTKQTEETRTTNGLREKDLASTLWYVSPQGGLEMTLSQGPLQETESVSL